MGEVDSKKTFWETAPWRSFRERSNFPRTFRDLRFRTWVSTSSIWKHTTSSDKMLFSFIIISQLRRPIELKFSQVYYFMHKLRYTPSKKTGIWQLPIVSRVFKDLLERKCQVVKFAEFHLTKFQTIRHWVIWVTLINRF